MQEKNMPKKMSYFKSWTQDVSIEIETFGENELTESSLHDLLKNPKYFAEGLQKGFIRISPQVGGYGFLITIDKIYYKEVQL